MNNNCLHTDHRSRMRQKFIENGDSQFYIHELLEMLLYYPIPRKNTNDTAHELINRFESIDRVFCAETDELTKCSGIGATTACFIKAVHEIGRRYIHASIERTRFASIDDIAAYSQSVLVDEDRDACLVISVNADLELVSSEKLTFGADQTISSLVKRITDHVLKSGSDRIVIFIKHIPGAYNDIFKDQELASLTSDTLRSIGAELLEVIVYDNGCRFRLHMSGSVNLI